MAAPPSWVAATQDALGPLVSAPPSSAALLRPTFHMLHSVVFEVKTATTFGEGAYTAEEEVGSDALSAEDQTAFLCKAMGLVGASLGSPIRLQVSAALRGDEAEATNLFLQRLAEVRKCTRCMHPPRASLRNPFPAPLRARQAATQKLAAATPPSSSAVPLRSGVRPATRANASGSAAAPARASGAKAAAPRAVPVKRASAPGVGGSSRPGSARSGGGGGGSGGGAEQGRRAENEMSEMRQATEAAVAAAMAKARPVKARICPLLPPPLLPPPPQPPLPQPPFPSRPSPAALQATSPSLRAAPTCGQPPLAPAAATGIGSRRGRRHATAFARCVLVMRVR
jgi:uncharacterized membrane protein YgcG